MPNCGTCSIYIPLQFQVGPQTPAAFDDNLAYLLKKAGRLIERGATPREATKDIYIYYRAMEHCHGGHK